MMILGKSISDEIQGSASNTSEGTILQKSFDVEASKVSFSPAVLRLFVSRFKMDIFVVY